MMQPDIDLNEAFVAREISTEALSAKKLSAEEKTAQKTLNSGATPFGAQSLIVFDTESDISQSLTGSSLTGSSLISTSLVGEGEGGEWSEASAVDLEDFPLKDLPADLSHQAHQVEAVSTDISAPSDSSSEAVGLGTLMVDLTVPESGRRVPTLVKGREDGKQAIALDQWLIPFEDTTRALGMEQILRPDGHVDLRSPDTITQVDLASGTQDPELGYVWSVADIEKQLGTAIHFDRDQYALQFNRSAVHEQSAVREVRADAFASALVSNADIDSAHGNDVPDGNGAPSSEVNSTDSEVNSTEGTVTFAEQTHTNAQIRTELAEVASDESASSELALSESASSESAISESLELLLVGLSVGDINTIEATLVKGRENGTAAVLFDQWLIPFEDAIAALGGHVTPQADGLVTIQAPGLATSLDLSELPTDPDLGMVISVADIADRFGIAAEFSFSDYAVRFLPPVDARSPLRNRLQQPDPPVVVEGLPVVSPANFGVSGIRQVTRFNNAQSGALSTPSGQFKAVGSLFGGSWYMRLNQPKIGGFKTWQLRELQYLRQSRIGRIGNGGSVNAYNADYVLGSQRPFWRSLSAQSDGQTYWGMAIVQRWGFVPPAASGRSGFDPQASMRSRHVGRTVSGEAAPGTFVQLTLGLNGPVVDEAIVDASGIYRFENVAASSQLESLYSPRSYIVNLYANGQLSGIPETRSATFTTLPGQLPQGASALIASAGMGHRLQANELVGNFQTFRGGLSYRRGLTESLTVGAGLVQDGSPLMMAEAFYLPKNIPLQAAVSTLVDATTGKTRVDADVRYQPARDLKMTFNSDRFSQRFKADWTPGQTFRLSAGGDTRTESLFLSARAAYRSRKWSGSANASIDTRQNFRWRLSASSRNFTFSNQGSELFTYSELAYRIPSRAGGTVVDRRGHKLVLGYETRRLPGANGLTDTSLTGTSLISTNSASLSNSYLATAEWRYDSPQRLLNGQSRWSYAVGYGMSHQDSGPFATASAAVGSGLDLQMRYQSVSAFSDRDTFQVSLVSQLNTQGGLRMSDSDSNRLRTRGGILVQPFFDADNDGDRDADEPIYLENLELLMQVNHRALRHYRAEIKSDGVAMPLAPATYRLDIDPAGLPLDRTAHKLSYAVDVIPGQYTIVPVPLALSYTVSGVVVDSSGEAVAGARVEAVSASGHRQLSITNRAGVYYLERLHPESYDIQVNGESVEVAPLELDIETESFLEREIHLL